MSTHRHETYMRRAMALTANVPHLPFGAVIVHREKGEVVAEGWNKSSTHPTWHGEIDAINSLVSSHPQLDYNHLTLYTTAEPCAMCQGAILWTGIGTVVFGTSIRFLRETGWPQIDIPAEEAVQRNSFQKCTIIGGVLAEECNALFEAALRARASHNEGE